jgi:hypothetical protein
MTPDRAKKTEQRQRVYARRKEIIDLLHAGWSGNDIRIKLDFEDIPRSSFYYNLKNLKREATTAHTLLAAELERLTSVETKALTAVHRAEASERGTEPLAPPQTKTEPNKISPTPSELTPLSESKIQPEEDSSKAKVAPKRVLRIGKIGGIPKDRRPLNPRKRND